jgi:hypothetical protein
LLTRHVRKANRFEIKYLVPHDAARRMVDAIEPYTVPDRHAVDEWGYPVYSVYWDSPRLALFWEKIEGLKYRRKLRFRRYADQPDVFVEIKQRVDRTLQKRRTRVSEEELRTWFEADAGEAGLSAPEDPVVSEAIVLRHRYRLDPRMAISYRRLALFGLYDADLRITFDRRVQYRATDFDIAERFDAGNYVVDPRLVIMEIKFSERVPIWLCKLVSREGLQMIRLSKYCTAVDREYYQNTLT